MNIGQFLKDNNLTKEFPADVLEQVAAIPTEVRPKDLWNRRDFRDVRTVTIDGDDAKDFDDAISIKMLPNGNYQLSVHIADVAHYVPEGSPIDKCAFERGTSVYLINHVIPMLHEKLSNGICSLNPGVPRLAVSVIMEIDPTGKIKKNDICESVITSDQRMTYNDVTAILDGDPKLYAKYIDHVDDFHLMRKLSDILKRKRIERGAIPLDMPEPKFILDASGNPIDVQKYKLTVSNSMIEEFMLAANETIAKHMCKLGIPLVYRVHEDPSVEKIEKLEQMLKACGIHMEYDKGFIQPKSLQAVLKKVAGTEYERAVSQVLLRSLMKARYCEENLGHFGLAAEYYCHFTSPIRRYPDLCVHRRVKELIHDKIKGFESIHDITDVRDRIEMTRLVRKTTEIAAHTSATERNAAEAERKWDNINIAKIMKPHEGEEFSGTIVGIEKFGIFVQLDNLAEGLVRMDDLKGGRYIYDDIKRTLRNQDDHGEYKIGDKMAVRLKHADPGSGDMRFSQIIADKELAATPYRDNRVYIKSKTELKKTMNQSKKGTKRDKHHTRKSGKGRF